MKILIKVIMLTLLAANSIHSQEYLEQQEVMHFNQQLSELKLQLKEHFEKAQNLLQEEAKETEFNKLLNQIKQIKEKIYQLEDQWRKSSVQEAMLEDEGYAFWDQGETTLSQLVMEYGASDFLYVVPYELGSMKISLFSNIPLPRESWDEMIELILSYNGVGVKKINTYVKQLYILKHDPAYIGAIAHSRADLELLSKQTRVFYIFSPKPEQLKAIQSFFERFSDPKQTMVHSVGCKVVIVSSKENIEKLMGLYEAIWEEKKGKVVKVVHLTKMNVQEAEKILHSFFSAPLGKTRPSFYQHGSQELITLQLPQGKSIVLIGESEIVERAEEIISDLENQLQDPMEMTIFWYTCKHSDPEDLAGVLEQVYSSLVQTDFDEKMDSSSKSISNNRKPNDKKEGHSPVNVVTPPLAEPGVINKASSKSHENFIVDGKTGSILMVVRRDELPKIKSLLRKLDVPKKMVQIDVLLMEKKMIDRKRSGMNLLKIGSPASQSKRSGISFDTKRKAVNKGILEFLISRPKNLLPAFDLTYNFLMAQENVRINANPSIIAINQTPATIAIVEEISINNGAVQVESGSGTSIEKSYTRAQFGITIVMTPTIHLPDPEETEDAHNGFITLQTNVTFDTTSSSSDERPPVTRRHIENEVRIADGETIILGGLRRTSSENEREKIPFLGDIPGLGKLFGSTSITDSNTEMFIFITPHIIRDPVEDLRTVRKSQLEMRPGDIPELLEKLEQAKDNVKKKLFEESFQLLFDKI